MGERRPVDLSATRLGRLAALVALVTASGCGDVGGDTDGPDLRGAAVPLPASVVDDLHLVRLDQVVPDTGQPTPVVVTDVGGHAVVVGVLEPKPEGGGADSLWNLGLPGPTLADGRPTVELANGPFHIRPALAARLGGDTIVTVAGRTSTIESLADVLEEVSLPLGERTAPGDVVGMVQDPDPTAVRASYGANGRGVSLLISEATPQAQAAYRALVLDEPARSIDPETEASCCERGILRPARRVDVAGRRGIIGTLSPYERILVVEGDPGLVVRDPHGGAVSDRDLVAVAAAVTAGTSAELEQLMAALQKQERDRQVEETAAYERSLGWTVLGVHGGPEVGVVLSSGTSRRPDQGDDRARLCAVVGVQGGTCLPAWSGAQVVEVAPSGFDLVFGAMSALGEAVEIVFPEGVVAAEVIELPPQPELPPRAFVAYIQVGKQIELTGSPDSDRMAQIHVIVRDANAHEVARVPLFPHLRSP